VEPKRCQVLPSDWPELFIFLIIAVSDRNIWHH